MHRLLPAAVALAGLLAAGCGEDDNATARPGAVTTDPVVELVDLEFEPDVITVDAGTEVTWQWTAKAMHNVVGDGFNSGNLAEGTFTHTFDQPGTYDYRCTLHPGMDGSVTVQ